MEIEQDVSSLTRQYRRAKSLLHELEDALDELESKIQTVRHDQVEQLQRQLRRARAILRDLDGLAADYSDSRPLRDLLDDVDRQLDRCDRLEVCLERLTVTGEPARRAPVVDNLPPSDLFVGRTEEIARCLEGLSPEERGWGVIIDGQGGQGKTALALAVAEQCRVEGRFGAYLWVSAKTTVLTSRGIHKDTLAPTTLDALLDELGGLLSTEVRRLPSTELKRAQLERALRGTAALLVLDNLETLSSEDRQQVGEFLRRLPPDCKAIVTSRRRSGESAVTVRLDRLPWQTARELFMQLGKREAPVQELVEHLGEARLQQLYKSSGGSPLALRWIIGFMRERGYSFERVLELLDNASQSSDLHDFVFQEALEQLSPEARQAFSGLALFRTPATLTQLAATSGLADEVTQSAVEQLVLLSLVESDSEHERFHLLPLTHTLARSYVDEECGLRFARTWADFARIHGGDHPEDFTSYDRLEAEWPNLEGGLAWLYKLSVTSTGRRAALVLPELVQSLRRFLWFRGYWNELAELGKQCFEVAQTTGNWTGAVWGAQCVAWVYGPYARNLPEATQWMKQLVQAAEQCGLKSEADIYVLRWEGIQARVRGEFDHAETCLQAVLRHCRAHSTPRQVATTLNDLGGVASDRQDYDRAAVYYQQARFQARGLREETACATLNLGLTAFYRGEVSLAKQRLEEGLAIAEDIHRRDLIAEGRLRLARVLAHDGQKDEALSLATQALAIFERLQHTSLESTRTLVQKLSD